MEKKVDLLFLDIQMPELNGIEFAKIIPPECRIIFVTAFEKYALDGFRNNAIDYLLKPVNYPEFLTAANRALQWAELKARAETRHRHNRLPTTSTSSSRASTNSSKSTCRRFSTSRDSKTM